MRDTAVASVLVVDDDTGIRNFLTLLLWQEGYAVRTAGDGAQALEFTEKGRPDVIVLDLMMPVMTGEEFLAEALQRRWSIPIILLSGYLGRGLVGGSQPDIVMSKPFEPEELVDAVNLVLRKQSDRGEKGTASDRSG